MSKEKKNINVFGRTPDEEREYQKRMSVLDLGSYWKSSCNIGEPVEIMSHPELRCAKCKHDNGCVWCVKFKRKPKEVLFDNAECAQFEEGTPAYVRQMEYFLNIKDDEE